MKKKEFMQELKEHLVGLPEEDVKEILEDYEEHFRMGKKKKRKEEEIAKSLGKPKEIAREARRELRKAKEISFEEEAIEFWVRTKRLGKKVWKNIEREIPKALESIDDLFKKKKKKKKRKTSKTRKRSGWKITLLVLLNLFVVLWLWVSLLAGIVSLIVSSWSVVASGIASVLGIFFYLAMPFTNEITNLLLAGLFSSIGITCLGFILSIATWQLGKGFFWLTGKYLRWNNKIFGGKKK